LGSLFDVGAVAIGKCTAATCGLQLTSLLHREKAIRFRVMQKTWTELSLKVEEGAPTQKRQLRNKAALTLSYIAWEPWIRNRGNRDVKASQHLFVCSFKNVSVWRCTKSRVGTTSDVTDGEQGCALLHFYDSWTQGLSVNNEQPAKTMAQGPQTDAAASVALA